MTKKELEAKLTLVSLELYTLRESLKTRATPAANSRRTQMLAAREIAMRTGTMVRAC